MTKEELRERRAAHDEYFRVTDPAWANYKAGKISLAEWRRIKSEAEKQLRARQAEASRRDNPAWASVFGANPAPRVYRGWEIQPEDFTQLGYRTHEGKSFGRGRKIRGYLLRGPDGATKVVSTLEQAHAYIDQYEGSP